MALVEDITSDCDDIFKHAWTKREGAVIPEPKDINLYTNDAVEFKEVAVLYADLVASTAMVNRWSAQFSAEVYRAFLATAARVIRSEGGAITAYDGDRVMAVFNDSTPGTTAVRCAQKINWAVINLLNPALKRVYKEVDHVIRHRVGIDKSPMFVARTGIRGGNDLVWVGRAANYAAKLAALNDSSNNTTFITEHMFKQMMDKVKYQSGDSTKAMLWEAFQPAGFPEAIAYRSNSTWSLP